MYEYVSMYVCVWVCVCARAHLHICMHIMIVVLFLFLGVKHPNIVCDGCDSQGIGGMRYKCTICYDYDLCYMCYHGDKHVLSHPFKRFDSATSPGYVAILTSFSCNDQFFVFQHFIAVPTCP